MCPVRQPDLVPAGRPEPGFTAIAIRELRHLPDIDFRGIDEEKLCDPIPSLDDELGVRIGIEQDDPHLTPVSAVDEAGGIDQSDAVAQGSPRPRKHQGGHPPRNGQRDTCSDGNPLSRFESCFLHRTEIPARISAMCFLRHLGDGIIEPDLYLAHALKLRARSVEKRPPEASQRRSTAF